MNIGQVIKDFRKEKGIKQGDFSNLCEISQTYLSLIENNQKDPNISTLKTISKNLNVPLPLMFFFSITEEDVPNPKKRDMFKAIEPSIKDLIKVAFSND